MRTEVNPLNTELNPICSLLALLGAHHFLHVSRIRVKIQGGTEVTERQGRRCTKPLDDLKEMRGYSHLNEEALDRTTWKARFGSGFGLS